jgi:hypothetical protein
MSSGGGPPVGAAFSASGGKKLKPYRDPGCQRYIDDPNRTFHSGRWLTSEQIERARSASREWRSKNPERLSEYYKNPETIRLGRERNRVWAGRRHLLGLPPVSPHESGRRGGIAVQDRYDKDPEAWTRNKRGLITAGLEKTRKRLEREDAENG